MADTLGQFGGVFIGVNNEQIPRARTIRLHSYILSRVLKCDADESLSSGFPLTTQEAKTKKRILHTSPERAIHTRLALEYLA
jgi:hypothetical protein